MNIGEGPIRPQLESHTEFLKHYKEGREKKEGKIFCRHCCFRVLRRKKVLSVFLSEKN